MISLSFKNKPRLRLTTGHLLRDLKLICSVPYGASPKATQLVCTSGFTCRNADTITPFALLQMHGNDWYCQIYPHTISQFCPILLSAFTAKKTSSLLPRNPSPWRKRSAVCTLQEINKIPFVLYLIKKKLCISNTCWQCSVAVQKMGQEGDQPFCITTGTWSRRKT